MRRTKRTARVRAKRTFRSFDRPVLLKGNAEIQMDKVKHRKQRRHGWVAAGSQWQLMFCRQALKYGLAFQKEDQTETTKRNRTTKRRAQKKAKWSLLVIHGWRGATEIHASFILLLFLPCICPMPVKYCWGKSGQYRGEIACFALS